jgi:dolichol-phosphate mannosyltransferase
MDRILVFLPTLNESKSASALVAEINNLAQVNFLVVDDGSKDGTYEELLSLKLDNLEIIQRGKRLGIGSAHTLAINFAIKKSYDFLLTMDADGTHRVEDVLKIANIRHQADLIVGSRFAQGAEIINWPWLRLKLTRSAHLVTRLGLGLDYDCSSGLRCYKLSAFERELIDKFDATGYDFFFKTIHLIARHKKSILDFPVTLEARVLGNSKMTISQAIKSISVLIVEVFKYRFKYIIGRF